MKRVLTFSVSIIFIISIMAAIYLFYPGEVTDNTAARSEVKAHQASLSKDFANLPLYFIPNQGQVDEDVRYYAQTTEYTLWMTADQLVFQWPGSVTRLSFSGANSPSGIDALGITSHTVNILRGPDSSKWQVNIPTFAAVQYKGMYNDIDLKVYGMTDKVEYDWRVKPGADPAIIGFRFDSSAQTRIDDEGNLVVRTESGKMVHKKPVSYQIIGRQKVEVETRFIQQEENQYGFQVGEYDNAYELVIDPLVLVYGSFVGGKYRDSISDMTVDDGGNVYLIGSTSSKDFPRKNAYQETGETFILKLHIAENGYSKVMYSTFYGGGDSPGKDIGYGIAVDNNGMIYATGYTTSSWLPKVNAYQNSLRGGRDAFLVKFDPSQTDERMLVFATYFGGSSSDTAFDIAVDEYGNAYITGETYSNDFPAKNGFQTTHGSGIAHYKDAFIAKLDTNSSGKAALLYSSYIASNAHDKGTSIAIDGNGQAYICGNTTGRDFPYKNGYQDVCNDEGLLQMGDIFILRVDTNQTWGQSLLYSTYLGGADTEEATSIAIDQNNNAYVTGFTRSKDFPLRNAYQKNLKWGQDAFISKINTDTTGDESLIYSTLLGGNGSEEGGKSIAVDNSGHAYVTGDTKSSNFPILNPLPGTPGGGFWDVFVTKLNVDGNNLVFSTYLGGNDYDYSSSIALDRNNNIYVAGNTYSTVFPITPGAIRQILSGNWNLDGFIIKIQDTESQSPTPKLARIDLDRTKLEFGACVSGPVTGAQSVNISNGGQGTMEWSIDLNSGWLNCGPDCGTENGMVSVSVDPTGLAAGTYTSTISVYSDTAENSPQSVEVTLKVYDTSHPGKPFGSFDTPTGSATVYGSIPFTGWALDNIGVSSVKIYRIQGSNKVYIGDAIFVEGARPDVEEAYRAYPNAYKGGWGYMLLTNFLPGGGNGQYTLTAVATDLEGNEVSLGEKMIACDNANAIKPFGALDTPEQGGLASGSQYVNFGWVLTPMPDMIPYDGSTIDVWVDGVNLGHPVYNKYRSDIASLFPGYVNSDGAVGYFYLDTTGMANGVHTIQWTARDTSGDMDGIGSRYFTVRNQTAGSASTSVTGQHNNQNFENVLKGTFGEPEKKMTIAFSRGFERDSNTGLEKRMKELFPGQNGVFEIKTKELEPIVLNLGSGGRLEGRLLVNGQFRSLPIGSAVDSTSGTFRWQPGAGFLGKFRLVFLETYREGQSFRSDIVIDIQAKH